MCIYIYIYINSTDIISAELLRYCIYTHKRDLRIALHYSLATFSVSMTNECAMLSIKIINIYLFK